MHDKRSRHAIHRGWDRQRQRGGDESAVGVIFFLGHLRPIFGHRLPLEQSPFAGHGSPGEGDVAVGDGCGEREFRHWFGRLSIRAQAEKNEGKARGGETPGLQTSKHNHFCGGERMDGTRYAGKIFWQWNGGELKLGVNVDALTPKAPDDSIYP
jgi:hypothetical protein